MKSRTPCTAAKQTLRRLRELGVAVGVLTNGNQQQQSMKIERICIAQLLDVFSSSEKLGSAYPVSPGSPGGAGPLCHDFP
ncbi:HAD family hydrolase [Arthrobacter sp. PAMC 25486]|uniref:HAD hydrolase-like protein n=1 Tax=Arthrobacter sp. PAMC 25486 TaxID=1494608 RepID=UPI0012FEF4AD